MMPNTMPSKGSGGEATADRTDSDAVSVAGPTGLRRLHPADGLFLRAEHLDQIQTYARTLAELGALAGGSGVVYGFELDLDPVSQVVGAATGLAIDPSGRALRGLDRMEVDLSGLRRDVPGRVWVVEVVAATPVARGSEPVYSAVCARPCGTGSAIAPWLDDTVALQVRAETVGGDWVGADPDRALSALVSAYFDRERRAGGPWLTPASPGAAVPELDTRPWAEPAPSGPPGPSGVPLGLLARIGDTWCLDVWGARRDRLPTPPAAAWQGHLALRPEPVFTAQLLQFSHQLAAGPLDPQHPLTDRFVELPPAGYLPRPLDLGPDGSLPNWLEAVFGGAVSVRPVSTTADAAVTHVQLARHLDRIPLRGHADPPPVVRILVPDVPADLPAVRTEDYSWLAFVREPRVRNSDPRLAALPAGPEPATLGVHVVEVDTSLSRGRYQQPVEDADDPPAAEIRFTEWEPEPDDDAVRVLREKIDSGGSYSSVDVVTTTAEQGDEPLAAARARALTTLLDLTGAETPAGVYTIRRDGPDAVYLMVRRAR